MISKKLTPMRVIGNQAVRSFGAKQHEQTKNNARNTSVNHADDHDIEHNIANKFNFNDQFLYWVSGRIPFDYMGDKLLNDKHQKYSAYNFWQTTSILQNKFVMEGLRLFFDKPATPGSVVDSHASFNGAQTHENGIYLYQSNQASDAVKLGYADFVTFGYYFGYLFLHPCFLMPSLVGTAFLPRRWTIQKYFTWHAELLPHTEQVVFHKTLPFGQVGKYIVDIKNLEKVGADHVSNPLMWHHDRFDPNMIFRDSLTQEVFVFDKQGIWNEEALVHPLLH